MVFTTQFFIFVFFPLCILSYLIIDGLARVKRIGEIIKNIRLKDIVIIIFSLGFYGWACFDNIYRLLLYILSIYLLGSCINLIKNKGNYIEVHNENNYQTKKIFFSSIIMMGVVALLLFIIIYYNYSVFLTQCWNKVFGIQLQAKSIMAPLGISFITFSAISYIVDIYRGTTKKGNLLDCILYITFFPKIISGPIVLYKDFYEQIKNRQTSLNMFASGINLIMVGFAKKVLLADFFGACQPAVQNIDSITALAIPLLYMLQIYYDFSGYSDIAIGISRLFGFEFKKNFNFPYRSTSISEFWRRWHISLGNWFREYVYFPLGGSRKGTKRTVINLGVVFALTGIWHGAGWNYILWGAINGVIVILERIAINKEFYKRIPVFIKYLFTMSVVMLFWLLFKYQSLGQIGDLFKLILNSDGIEAIPYNWKYYYDLRVMVFVIIGILCATVLGCEKVQELHKKIISSPIGYIVEELILIVLFIISILFMINSTYSPFIYFQY